MSNFYEAIVIGGGITGAGIFWDLSLHGVKTLIVDRGDFAAQTSQRSSKMLHGGIRYLENMDFHLVYEALHEKNLWRSLRPDLCYESSFLLPIYKNSKYNLPLTALGLLTYDLLSGFQNTPFKVLNRESALNINPGFKRSGLKGAGLYHDVIVDDAKLTMEVILDGLMANPQSKAQNYQQVTAIDQVKDLYTVTLEDSITHQQSQVTTRKIVCATGPFTDKFLQNISLFSWTPQLLPSKGIHLWLKKDALKINSPAVIQTRQGRVVFIIPHDEAILVGTTESEPEENYFNITANTADINYLIEELNRYFEPTLTTADIISSFAGVRPLAKDDTSSANRGKTSREHRILQPRNGFFVIIGGKLTTFRVMGQEITRNIVNFYGHSYSTKKTQQPFKTHSQFLSSPTSLPSKQQLQAIIQREFPRTLEDLLFRRLAIYSPAHWKMPINQQQFLEMNKDILQKLSS